MLPTIGGARGSAEEKKPAEPLKQAPRAYYRDHCQRCHGVDGCNFLPGYAQRESTEKLKADVKRMADGPGDLPLKEFDLEVQTAYARLASAGKPFLSWIEQKDLFLTGEFSDGATVTAMIGEKPIKVETNDDEDQWRITLPSKDDLKLLKVTATIDKKSIELRPYEQAYADTPKPKQ